MKKVVSITGKIVFPLKEGYRAVMSCSDGLIYTSPVAEIIAERPDFAHFETLNSVYTVSLEPVSMHAAIPPFLKMCA